MGENRNLSFLLFIGMINKGTTGNIFLDPPLDSRSSIPWVAKNT